jgi:hypothetical protein
MRQTRPTSTSLHDDALISASPIMYDSEGKMLAKCFWQFVLDSWAYWAFCRGLLSLDGKFVTASISRNSNVPSLGECGTLFCHSRESENPHRQGDFQAFVRKLPGSYALAWKRSPNSPNFFSNIDLQLSNKYIDNAEYFRFQSTAAHMCEVIMGRSFKRNLELLMHCKSTSARFLQSKYAK